MNNKKIVLITGATSGIGKATSIKFAKEGYDIIITGRRGHLLKELKYHLESNFEVSVLDLNFDIRNLESVNISINSISKEWKEIDILVNNAGLAAGIDPFQNGSIDDWEQMIDTNIKGLLYISKVVSQIMISNKKGHIINIGSIAGKDVYANGNVYCATKFAVDALTKGMRIDLLEHNIKVSQIAPGAVETEFSLVRFHGDKEKANNVYKGFEPLIGEDIADIIWYIANLPKHVNINDLVVVPTAQASPFYLNKKQ